MYDVTKRSSFENLVRWLEEMKENAYSKMVIILIGNKIDLEEEYYKIICLVLNTLIYRREVSFEEG